VPEVALRLADAGLSGIKDSTRSLERHCEYLKIASGQKRRFEVYMVTDGLAWEALQRGSAGIVSAIANVAPELFLHLRRAVQDGRAAEASAFQAEINELRTSLQQGDTITNLKLRVGQRLMDSAKEYPAVLRMPLGTTR